MITFLIGVCILAAGGVLYGRICERVMKPSDSETPAKTKYDGVDYVPMKKWKNSLIELLNSGRTLRANCLYHHTHRLRHRRSFSRLYERNDLRPE